jgi:uncharacterized protein YjbI with pentapeptide repeats
MILDNLDLSGRDFSCAKMSQSHFHRTSFAGADLRRADLRGTQLADFSTPDYPGDAVANKGGGLEWQRYRCLVTDFRDAKLNEANFQGAVISGADFSGADLTGVNFCRADLSRVNFSNTKGLTAEMLSDACVGESIKVDPADEGSRPPVKYSIKAAQPRGISSLGENFQVPRCLSTKRCIGE